METFPKNRDKSPFSLLNKENLNAWLPQMWQLEVWISLKLIWLFSSNHQNKSTHTFTDLGGQEELEKVEFVSLFIRDSNNL